MVISTDAHRIAELDSMRYGVDQARRGWCAAEDVANTRPLTGLRRLLEKHSVLPPVVRLIEPSARRRVAIPGHRALSRESRRRITPGRQIV